MVSRWRSLSPLAQDLALAIVFAAVWFGAYTFWTAQDWRPVRPDTWVTAGLWTAGAIALRRIVPRALLGVTVLYPWVYDAPLQTEFHLLPVLIAAYGAASSGRVSAPMTAGVAMVPTTLLAYLTVGPFARIDLSTLLFHLAAVGGVAFLGALVYRQRDTAETLAQRNTELLRLREVEAERAVVEERTRIARDLHDVVAHHLVALIVRGQAAHRLVSTQPEYAAESVPWMVDTARDALTAMRQTVRVLRVGEEAPMVPEPTLADLWTITRRVTDAGIVVDLRVDTDLVPMSDQAQLAAVRITQEALTNVLRHTDADHATVILRRSDNGIWLEVEDNGATLPFTGEASDGHGLVGMRERADACGGSLEIDSGQLGGWRVRAWFPSEEVGY